VGEFGFLSVRYLYWALWKTKLHFFYGLCDLFTVYIGGVFWDGLEIVVC